MLELGPLEKARIKNLNSMGMQNPLSWKVQSSVPKEKVRMFGHFAYVIDFAGGAITAGHWSA